jgi:CBS domain-containing protein
VGLRTTPDFEYEYIDGYIRFLPVETEPATVAAVGAGGAVCDGTADVASAPALSIGLGTVSAQATAGLPIETVSEAPISVPTIPADPTYRIGKLAAANRVPASVKPDSTIAEATTLMLINNFSQLPVMQSEMTVKGVVSWESIGKRLALGLLAEKVSDCMDRAVERPSEDSLFAIIADIVQYQYVLIRGTDNRIKGIVTTSDLSLQFGQLAEPFLLIGEIEQHIRMLIEGRFSLEELKAGARP